MKEDKKHNQRKDPFPAPDGYFDGLSDRIMDRIDREEESKAGKGRMISLATRAGWAAAAVISLLAVFWLITTDDSSPTSQELVAELSDDEIIDYLVSTDISLDDILDIAAFENADLDSLNMEAMPDLDISPEEADELIELYDLEELENS